MLNVSAQEATKGVEPSSKEAIDPPRAESLQAQLSPQEWIREFDSWVGSHDPDLPVLSDAAMSRDTVYD